MFDNGKKVVLLQQSKTGIIIETKMDVTKIPASLPIGNSFFDQVIEDGSYYVDKTLFIKDLLDRAAKVTLCTRPRRFGKTLNQTMLKTFFEDTTPIGGKDTRALFRGLNIARAGERYMEHQGKYPVIFLSFKDTESERLEITSQAFKHIIAREFRRHDYIAESITKKTELEMFEKLSSGEGEISQYRDSLLFLCECLENFHGQKTVIIIDEYDVPLQSSWTHGFYDGVVHIVRPLLSCALKDNPHLQFAVITGCLRISKESIFTGLNNLDVISILNECYDDYFGFTQDEMNDMLVYYGLESKTQIIKDWYNGYLFGKAVVYNPWSAILAISNWRKNKNKFPEPHWVNTSRNAIVRDLIDRADFKTKIELDTLIEGGSISKIIHEDITYDEVFQNPNNLWNFMFFTGYLKKITERTENKKKVLELAIPNMELQYIYETKIQEWFEERIRDKDLVRFFDAILSGDVVTFQSELAMLLIESISFMDNAENFYHGFMVGVLSRLNGYLVKSNRESGHGRSDLVMYSVNGTDDKAVIFELKTAKTVNTLPVACADALQQIEKNNYASYWKKEGYKIIIKYGIGFCKKRCLVAKA
jgi:hypothetical protein